MTAEIIKFIAGTALMAAGAIVEIIAVFGVFKLRDPLSRMHSAGLGDTLGLLFIMLGLCVFINFNMLAVKLLLTVAVFWCASPVVTHMIGRMITSDDENKKQ